MYFSVLSPNISSKLRYDQTLAQIWSKIAYIFWPNFQIFVNNPISAFSDVFFHAESESGIYFAIDIEFIQKIKIFHSENEEFA